MINKRLRDGDPQAYNCRFTQIGSHEKVTTHLIFLQLFTLDLHTPPRKLEIRPAETVIELW